MRLGRFCFVGASGVGVNSGLLLVLVHVAGLPLLVAAPIATEVAILFNFVLNDLWTFRASSRQHRILVRAARYNVVCLGGLVISVSAVALLVELVATHYLLANLCGIALASAWNFCVNARVTWAMPIGLRGFWLARRLMRGGRLAAVSVRERDRWT